MDIGGNHLLNNSTSKYSNIPTKMRPGNIGPTAESALLFNTSACISLPNDAQFSGVGNDGSNRTTPPNPSFQPSSWSQSVANFRQQQQLQRNLLIVKQQKAAAAAHNQQHGFIRQQNNLSHKRLMYQNSNFGLMKTIPPPPPPPPPPQHGLIRNGVVAFNTASNSAGQGNQQQSQQNQFSGALKNNLIRSLDTSEV